MYKGYFIIASLLLVSILIIDYRTHPVQIEPLQSGGLILKRDNKLQTQGSDQDFFIPFCLKWNRIEKGNFVNAAIASPRSSENFKTYSRWLNINETFPQGGSVIPVDEQNCAFCYYYAIEKIIETSVMQSYCGFNKALNDKIASRRRDLLSCSGGNLYSTIRNFVAGLNMVPYCTKPGYMIDLIFREDVFLFKNVYNIDEIVTKWDQYSKYPYLQALPLHVCLDNLQAIPQTNTDYKNLYYCSDEADYNQTFFQKIYSSKEGPLLNCRNKHVALLLNIEQSKTSGYRILNFWHQWKDLGAKYYGSEFNIIYEGKKQRYPCRIGYEPDLSSYEYQEQYR